MRNQHSENPSARSGRAVTDRQAPKDGAHAEGQRANEPRGYVARDIEHATLAPPAAGEVTDYFDEGDPSGGAQQGRDRTRLAEKDAARSQGRKTREANQQIVRTGSADRIR